MLKFNVNPNKAQQINGKPLIITLFKIQSCQEHVAKSQLKIHSVPNYMLFKNTWMYLATQKVITFFHTLERATESQLIDKKVCTSFFLLLKLFPTTIFFGVSHNFKP